MKKAGGKETRSNEDLPRTTDCGRGDCALCRPSMLAELGHRPIRTYDHFIHADKQLDHLVLAGKQLDHLVHAARRLDHLHAPRQLDQVHAARRLDHVHTARQLDHLLHAGKQLDQLVHAARRLGSYLRPDRQRRDGVLDPRPSTAEAGPTEGLSPAGRGWCQRRGPHRVRVGGVVR